MQLVSELEIKSGVLTTLRPILVVPVFEREARVQYLRKIRVLLLRVRDTTRARIMGCVSDTSESSEKVNEKRDILALRARTPRTA